MPLLAEQIEIFLLTEQRWIGAEELCAKFGVRERQLRDDRMRPGLCTEFAISGDQGYRHIRCATDEELDRFILRLRTHGIAELRRVKKLREARRNALTGRPAVEKFTGQGMLI